MVEVVQTAGLWHSANRTVYTGAHQRCPHHRRLYKNTRPHSGSSDTSHLGMEKENSTAEHNSLIKGHFVFFPES